MSEFAQQWATELANAMAYRKRKERCLDEHGYGCTKCFPSRGPVKGLADMGAK